MPLSLSLAYTIFPLENINPSLLQPDLFRPVSQTRLQKAPIKFRNIPRFNRKSSSSRALAAGENKSLNLLSPRQKHLSLYTRVDFAQRAAWIMSRAAHTYIYIYSKGAVIVRGRGGNYVSEREICVKS